MSLIDHIEQMDVRLFLYLNSKHGPGWDSLMFWITHKFTWIPFYLFLLVIVYRQFRKKTGYILLCIAVLIMLSDQSSVLLKNTIRRYRPCHNTEIRSSVHTLYGKCGGQFGFVSSHAANTFALAMFLGLLFKREMKKNITGIALLGWAALVSYSRIYSGVHYPLDIAGGMLLGIVLAFLLHQLYRYTERQTGRRSGKR